MSEKGAREWRFYLDDMISLSEKVLAYSEGFEHEAFFSDSMRYDATVRNLELIGEAATRIPEAVRKRTSGNPVALGHRYAEPFDSRRSRNRQRYPLEHHPG